MSNYVVGLLSIFSNATQIHNIQFTATRVGTRPSITD